MVFHHPISVKLGRSGVFSPSVGVSICDSVNGGGAVDVWNVGLGWRRGLAGSGGGDEDLAVL